MSTVPTRLRRILALATAAVTAASVATTAPAAAQAAATPPTARPGPRVDTARLPIAFTRNDGQAAPAVRYLGQAQGVSVWFTATGVTLGLAHGPARLADAAQHLPAHAGVQLTLAFRRASLHPQITSGARQAGTVNYIAGSSPARWHTHIPSYAQVTYRGLWPGITATFTTSHGSLRYSFALAPGARASEIRLAYTGARHLAITRSGSLAIGTAGGVLTDQAPVTSQARHGHSTRLPSRYRLTGGTSFGFSTGRPAPGAAVTIDPGLDYSTYLGGSCADSSYPIGTDAAGDLYLAGESCSPDYPTTPGAYQQTNPGHAFTITKLNPTGTSLIYSTFVSGTSGAGNGEPSGAVNRRGDVYVAGYTYETDFPTTAGAYRTTPFPDAPSYEGVAFKLNPAGSRLLYSTYTAPDLSSGPGSLGLAPDGSVAVTGSTDSDNAPTTRGAFQTVYPGGSYATYVARLNPAGSRLIYGTYLGAPITSQGGDCVPSGGLAVGAKGAAYVGAECTTGFPTTRGAYQPDGTSQADGLLVKLNPGGTRLDYATYYGTPAATATDFIVRIDGVAVNRSGDAYLIADAPAGAAPATPGAYAANCTGSPSSLDDCTAVAEFNPSGTGLVYSTYFGGNNDGDADSPTGLAIDSSGNAYVTGAAAAEDIPTTPGAYSSSPGSYTVPWYLATFGSSGGLLYATYFGGSGAASVGGILSANVGSLRIAPHVTGGNVYLGGATGAANFPVTPGAFQTTDHDTGLNSGFAAELTLPSLAAAARRGGYHPRARYQGGRAHPAGPV